jgi:hypothetical protein
MRTHSDPRTLTVLSLFLAVACLPGCSLITIESPEMPLSEREMNARLSTHRFVEHFIEVVTATADRISEAADASEKQAVALDAIRWKLGATAALTSSGFETSSRDALVDSWAYCAQMTSFFREGAGQSWFGSQHDLALASAVELEGKIADHARRFAAESEAERWEEFVTGYAAATPLPDMSAPRASSVPAFYEFMQIDALEAIETVGSLGQVLESFSTQVSVMGQQVPQEVSWRTDLFLHEQGIGDGSLNAELALLGSRLERVANVADRTPELLDSSLAQLQEEVAALIEALSVERAAVMDSLRGERVAALEALSQEREIILAAVSRERAATQSDLERYGDKLVEDLFAELEGLAMTAMIGLVALALVVLGVPFGIGVLVGRLARRSG